MACCQPSAKEGYNPAVFPLTVYPVAVFFGCYRGEADFHTEVVGFEQEVFEDVARHIAGCAYQDTERQCVVDVGLAYIQDHRVVFRQDSGKCRCNTGTVVSAYVYQNQLEVVGNRLLRCCSGCQCLIFVHGDNALC